MKRIVFILMLISALTLFASEQIRQEKRTLDGDGIKRLDIECGAGFLKVNGEKELEQILLDAEIIVQGVDEDRMDAFLEKHLDLRLEKHGSTAKLVARIRSGSGFFSRFLSSENALVNLTVRVPEAMDLDVSDGSGSIEIRNISGEMDITDGSGSLTIGNIQGNIEVDDGSGSLSIDRVSGDLDINDGSGDVNISDISGDIDVDDGSGSLILRSIVGNIVIDDGSGEIEVTEINGDVRLSDGSGSIHIRDVTQDVTILDDGSGSVEISNVKGRVIREDD